MSTETGEIIEHDMEVVTLPGGGKTVRPARITRLVPVLFWDDHESRDLAEGARIIEQKGRRYLIEFTPDALHELESDADYYGHHMPEFERESPYGRSICTSARATLRALEVQA